MFLRCFSFKQHVFNATHFTDHSQTLIDLVCSDARPINVTTNPNCMLGGHAFITATFLFRKEKNPPRTVISRNFKNIPVEVLNNCLDIINWNSTIASQNVNEMVTFLNSHIINIFDALAPLKTRSLKERFLSRGSLRI